MPLKAVNKYQKKDKLVQPSVPEGTIKSHMWWMFCPAAINDCQITMFPPCGTWSTVLICQCFEREAYLAAGLLCR